jgi:hypothetical protein
MTRTLSAIRHALWSDIAIGQGQHGYLEMRAGLQPEAALADEIYLGLGSLLRNWGDYGTVLGTDLVAEAEGVMTSYWEWRQSEGGPGLVNRNLWGR